MICLFLPFECAFTAIFALGIGHTVSIQQCVGVRRRRYGGPRLRRHKLPVAVEAKSSNKATPTQHKKCTTPNTAAPYRGHVRRSTDDLASHQVRGAAIRALHHPFANCAKSQKRRPAARWPPSDPADHARVVRGSIERPGTFPPAELTPVLSKQLQPAHILRPGNRHQNPKSRCGAARGRHFCFHERSWLRGGAVCIRCCFLRRHR